MPNVLETRLDIKLLMSYNLMNDHMIANLVNERKTFIRKTATKEITKEECLKLLALELNVMAICSSAIDKYHIPRSWFIDESVGIMKLLCNRIDHLYFSMFQMFSIGCVLLVEYMEFQSKYKKFITNEIHPLIVLMSKKKCEPQMYIAAATFEYEKQNIQMARRYFEEGIIKHINNKTLYLEQLWIEVMYLGDVGGGHLNEMKAIQIYKNTIKHFENDMEFHILLLDRSIEVKPLWRLQHEIVCDLMEIYKLSDVMWHKVATLCADGFIFDQNNNSFFGYVKDFQKRARCCILTYNEGLKNVLNVTRKRNLMKLLTEYIIKLWKCNNGIRNSEINTLVKREMKKAFQVGHFHLGGLHKPEYYVYWAVLCQDNRPEILQLAIDYNKENVRVWAEVLEYYVIHFESYTTLKKIFDVGYQALGNKSLLLWEITDSVLQQYCDVTLLGKFYEEGAKSPYPEISNVYKVDYLEWIHMYDGISSARKLFDQLKNLEPQNKKLYTDMIEYEKLQQPINVSNIRNLYNVACSKFCRQGTEVTLWSKCIEFELTYIGRATAEKIYKMALQIVKPHLRTDLKRNYKTINEIHSKRTVTIDPVVIEISDDDE
ncbi:U3 small nucleolar RNA-associated protein 6 homolog [Metopolophium dirhodum]|uniref:U3 small nucleolar RNA-associated protein 6 homolog n=1 Tax=Metopolophium dirhodum TaxID=44670 RepID=UPI0029907F8B|nr:U3 small nucleolar RNA-associated protein 6 homolog [Metopolophium dirhodum]